MLPAGVWTKARLRIVHPAQVRWPTAGEDSPGGLGECGHWFGGISEAAVYSGVAVRLDAYSQDRHVYVLRNDGIACLVQDAGMTSMDT
jgi:hypothetical protein